MLSSTARLLPSNQQWVSRWGVTAGLVGTHPWPLHEWLTKWQEPFLWLSRKGAWVGSQTKKAPSIEHMSTLQIQPPFSWLQTKSIVKRKSNQGASSMWEVIFQDVFLTNRAGMTDRITTETNVFWSSLTWKLPKYKLSVSENCFSEWIGSGETKEEARAAMS